MSCTAEARPDPSYEIFFSNETMLVASSKTYTIHKVNIGHVGNYTCVAKNILDSASSVPVFLSLEGRICNATQQKHPRSISINEVSDHYITLCNNQSSLDDRRTLAPFQRQANYSNFRMIDSQWGVLCFV